MMELDNGNIDIDSLREDLKDYFIGMHFNVAPAAIIEAFDVDNATDSDVIDKAREYGFNLSKYLKFYQR